MDYLRFLGLSVFALVLIGLEGRFVGAGLGTFVAAGFTISFFVLRGSRRHAIAYAAWLVLLLGWILLLGNSLKTMVAQHPEQAARLRAGEGLLLLVAVILLHPLCYGLAWLVTRNQPPPGTPNPPGSRNRKRRLLLIFCFAVLLALLVGTVAEHVLHMPAKPFEYYIALGSLLVGAVVAAIAARRT